MNTYVNINYTEITNNIKKIINEFNNYDYYFGVVKANCYGHDLSKSLDSILAGGCNYLAVANIDEAIAVRKLNSTIPILCLGFVHKDLFIKCYTYNISISINSLDYAKEISEFGKSLTVHLKVNTGMNRYGISSFESVLKCIELLSTCNIEGIFSHIYDSSSAQLTSTQINFFENLLSKFDENRFRIRHIQSSSSLAHMYHSNRFNAVRLGIIMYGFTNYNLNLSSTFNLVSTIVQLQHLDVHDTLGYNSSYRALERETIAIVPVGYADGVIRKNTGRFVYINDKKFQIVGNICMDVLFVKVDKTVSLHDKVHVLRDNSHILEVADYLDTIPYEIISTIGPRVPRL